MFRYIPQLNSLTIEDFGTLGMNAKRWKEYQSLWDTTKAEEPTLGARGQGKFLFHYFAKNKLVLTESIDEEKNYRFSFGTSEEYDDENKKLEDFIPNAKPLDHQGTRIWIMDLKQELRDELLDYKAFMNYIAATWWEIIRNWNATFIVNFNGTDHKVVLPELPVAEKEKVFPSEKIIDLGKVKKLVLRYCKNEVPELYRGIAVQRGGMTILRLPVSAEETIKNKIYGYCTFDEDLESELKKVELPNHFGFNPKRAWNHTREYIRKKSDEFVQEISPVRKREITLPQDLIERAVLIVNNLVREYAPELAAEVTGPGGGKKPVEKPYGKRPLPDIRIDTFRGNARKLEYDESLITECELVNDTDNAAKLQLRIEVRHEEGDLKFNPRYTIVLDSNKRERIDIPLVDFQENIDKPGEYKATAVLENGKETEPHTRSFTFYLHEEPPPPRGRVFLSTMRFLYGKGKPFERSKQLPLTDKAVLYIIFDHPDFAHVREVAGSKKAQKKEVFLYSIKCGIDEAVQKLLEFKYNEGQLDTEEIRVIKAKCDAMYYDAVLSPTA
ncbi:hypothetical protein E3J84_06225 [Candidatus Aerophobetes bacterium]|uniref:Uncharacterized protein n=1 Tax=Aerophobetes bacterium TaxID=2030807 RepID=A0A523RRM9_UNCAE|nr:MAG: hypothetical protein E3J84_06225 [Candidatus Aerophobetes bacterium]